MVVGGTGSDFVLDVAVDLRPVRTEERHKPIRLLARNGKVGRSLQSRPKTFVAGHVAVGNQGHHAQARDARLAGIQRGK